MAYSTRSSSSTRRFYPSPLPGPMLFPPLPYVPPVPRVGPPPGRRRGGGGGGGGGRGGPWVRRWPFVRPRRWGGFKRVYNPYPYPFKRLSPPRMLFSHEEQAYVNCVVNPFGHLGDGAFLRKMAGRIPDASGCNSMPMTFTCSTTITGDAATAKTDGIIKLCNLTNDAGGSYGIMWASSAAGAPAPTLAAAYTIDWEQQPSILSVTKRWRVVGMGLKVTRASGGDLQSGVLQGGITSGANILTGGGPAYSNYALFKPQLERHLYTVPDGITVRWMPQDNSDFEYEDFTARVAFNSNVWRAPTVFFRGLGDGTVLNVQAVLHVEAIVEGNESGFVSTPSPVSTRWLKIHSLTTHPEFAPICTRGWSFKTIFNKIGQAVGGAARFLRNAGTITRAVMKVWPK